MVLVLVPTLQQMPALRNQWRPRREAPGEQIGPGTAVEGEYLDYDVMSSPNI